MNICPPNSTVSNDVVAMVLLNLGPSLANVYNCVIAQLLNL